MPFNIKYLRHLARTRLGISLSAAVLVIILATTAGLALVSFYFITAFGEKALDLNRENLLRQARSHLSKSINDEAAHCSFILERAEKEVRNTAKYAARLLDNAERYEDWNRDPDEVMIRDPDNGIFSNGPAGMVSVVYWDKPYMDRAANIERNVLSHLDPVLKHNVEQTPGAIASWFMSRIGMTRYYPNIDIVRLMPPASEFDFRDDICFTAAAPENNPGRGVVWSDIYQDSVDQGLMLTVNMPCWDSRGRFRASLGIDISLHQFLSKVLGIDAAPMDLAEARLKSAEPPTEEFKFVIDSTGTIIAFPPELLPVFGLPLPEHLNPGEKLGLSLPNSTIPQVRTIAAEMMNGKKGINRLQLGNTSLLIAHHPLKPAHWSLAIAAPESDILSSVQRTDAALTNTIRGLGTRFFLIAPAMMLLATAVILSFFSRRILSPLKTVLDTVRDLGCRHGSNAPARRTGLVRDDEMGELGREVDKMADQIEASRDSLAEAEKRYRNIYENAIEGLFQLNIGPPRKAVLNQAMAHITGYDSPEDYEEAAADPSTTLFYAPEDRAELLSLITQHGRVDEYEIRLARKDGSPVWTQLSAKEVRDENGTLIRYEGFCLDIDEKIRAREKALNHSRELIKIGEAERRRIALELHDSVGQDLSALRISFEAAQDLKTPANERRVQSILSRNIITKAVRDIRDLAYELRPSTLEEMGLETALKSWLETVRSENGPEIDFQATGLGTARFGFETEINLFRIVQEFVNNSLKHANAETISIRIVVSHPCILLRMKDNGQGFDSESRPLEALKERSMGLWSMSERTKLLGGNFNLAARPGRGVQAKVEIPCEAVRNGKI